MKNFTNRVLLFAAVMLLGGAFSFTANGQAQTPRVPDYYASSTTNNKEGCTADRPCTPERAFQLASMAENGRDTVGVGGVLDESSVGDELVVFLVSAPGATFDLMLGETESLDDAVTLGLYMREGDSTKVVPGTINIHNEVLALQSHYWMDDGVDDAVVPDEWAAYMGHLSAHTGTTVNVHSKKVELQISYKQEDYGIFGGDVRLHNLRLEIADHAANDAGMANRCFRIRMLNVVGTVNVFPHGERLGKAIERRMQNSIDNVYDDGKTIWENSQCMTRNDYHGLEVHSLDVSGTLNLRDDLNLFLTADRDTTDNGANYASAKISGEVEVSGAFTVNVRGADSTGIENKDDMVQYYGWLNSPGNVTSGVDSAQTTVVYRGDRFQISGGGSIKSGHFYKTTAAGVDMSVDLEFTKLADISGGVLNFTGNNITGNGTDSRLLVRRTFTGNIDTARASGDFDGFVGQMHITNATVDVDLVSTTNQYKNTANGYFKRTDADPVGRHAYRLTHWHCARGLIGGIYATNATFTERVIVNDFPEVEGEDGCSGGIELNGGEVDDNLDVAGHATLGGNVTIEGNLIASQNGTFSTNGSVTVENKIVLTASTLGNGNPVFMFGKSGSLTLEGDLLGSKTATVFGGANTDLDFEKFNPCDLGSGNGVMGVVRFAGGRSASISGNVIRLNKVSLEIAKDDAARDSVVVGVTTALVVPRVKLSNGILSTKGKLKMHETADLIVSEGGSLSRGGAKMTYLDRSPDNIIYHAGDITTGDELMLVKPTDKLDYLVSMTEGTLNIASSIAANTVMLVRGSVSLGANVTVDNKSGRTYVGAVEVSGAGTYSSSDLHFEAGNHMSGSKLIATHPTTTTIAKATKPNVTVDGCAAKTVKLALGEGFTPLATAMVMDGNTLDLNGNDLVAYGNVTVESEAVFHDSYTPSDGEAGKLVSDLSEALAAVSADDTPENREALRKVRDELLGARDRMGTLDTATAGRFLVAGAAVTLDLQTDQKNMSRMVPPTEVLAGGSLTLKNMGQVSAEKEMAGFPSLMVHHRDTTAKPTKMGGELMLHSGYDEVAIHGDLMLEEETRFTVGSVKMVTVMGDLMVGCNGDMPPVGNATLPTLCRAPVVNVGNNTLVVGGDYKQYSGDDMMMGSRATVMFGNNGKHVVMGSFVVGPSITDTDANGVMMATSNMYDLGDLMDPHVDGAMMPTYRGLFAHGEMFAFYGTGDMYTGMDSTMHGLTGAVTLAPMADTMMLSQGDAAASQLGNVYVNVVDNNDAMVMTSSNVVQHASGRLYLEDGVLFVGDGFKWTTLKSAHENVGDIITSDDEGTVSTAEVSNFIVGALNRMVKGSGSDRDTTGYNFPLGVMDEDGMEGHYTPLAIQLDAGEDPTMLSASAMMGDDMAMSLPEGGLTAANEDGSHLILDAVGPVYWKVMGDDMQALDLRVSVQDLPNVFRISGLRIVRWDCDGSNAMIAGTYVHAVDGDHSDTDNTFAINDFVHGIPTITQFDLELSDCNVYGIAANSLENPINADPLLNGAGYVQLVHNVVGLPVDVYADGNRIADDVMFQSALPYAVLSTGAHVLEVTAANAPDNSTALVTLPVNLTRGESYQVVASGDPTMNKLDVHVAANVRRASMVANTVDFMLVHGSAGVGMVDVRTLDPMDNTRGLMLWANNAEFGDVQPYMTVDPTTYNVEVSSQDNSVQHEVFRFNFGDYGNEAVTLALSGGSSGSDLTIMGVMDDGSTFFPQVITSTEAEELPTEFALLGNYPNPFNPSTRISFDLPESARVSIAVYDMLGREVMVLPAQDLEAGANRSVELNALQLASGNYFYQVIATGVSGRHIETGRMVLIK